MTDQAARAERAERAEAAAEIRRRKVRKGTHSCWECRRRKIRCQFSPNNDTVCVPCQARGSACRSQEFADDSRPQQQPDRRMAQRLGRLEELMARLVDRIMPEASRTITSSTSGRSASGPSDRASPTPSHDTVTDDDAAYRPALDILQNSASSESPVGLLLGLRYMENNAQKSPSMLTPESEPTNSCPTAGRDKANTPTSAKAVLSKYDKICRALHALFPSQHDIDLFTKTSVGVYFLTSLFISFRDSLEGKSETAETLAAIPPSASHPTVLSKRLLQICICMQQMGPSFDVDMLQMKTSYIDTMTNIISTIADLVTCNDELVGTAEGLETLVLQGIWHANAGNLRKAWLSYRRAISLGQLMGIDHGSSRLLKFVDPTTAPNKRPTAAGLWYRINFSDRFASLLLGLPVGSPDNSFATEEAMKRDTQMERLEKRHTVIAGRIIERNANKTSEAYAITQSIDCDLENAAASLGQDWWQEPSLGSPLIHTAEKLGPMLHLMQQIHHFDLLILLHLPYMLRSPSESRYEYSKMTCARASREVLKRFIPFRAEISAAWACRHVDYSALVAAMTLLLSYLRQHQEPSHPTPSCEQRAEDRALVELVRERMQHVGVINQDKLSHEAADMLGRMMPILDSIDASLTNGMSELNTNVVKCLQISIPYLGTVNIHPSMSLPATVVAAPSTPVGSVCPRAATAVETDACLRGEVVPSFHDANNTGIGQVQPEAQLAGLETVAAANVAAQQSYVLSHMDLMTMDPSLLPRDATINGMWMDFDPQPMDGVLEFPDLMAEADDWVFQGIDTTYWSLLNGGNMGWTG
ncbi:hypothetical protein B0T17DRAFT_379367 [Bombardia bombarda]|uniref:Zn(2)-C6 fungal-type domain-containing protein n=1 Tax=Bombardia bombarda TaxID=252184 RepID=A0AA40BVF8_9PEZI|nr:hypothetical protein B0T17DRAFT_379367 [Bombardia bombarda]